MKKIIIFTLLLISTNLISKDFYYNQNKKIELTESEYFLTIKSDKQISLEVFDEISEIKEYKRGVGEYLILKLNKKINENIKQNIKKSLKDKKIKFLKTYKVFNDKLWPKFYDRKLFVKFKNSSTKKEISEIIKKFNLKNGTSYKNFKNLYFFETNLDALTLANEIYESKLVEYSAADFYYKFHPDFVPNDNYFSDQWHHGSSYGGMNSVAAWDINKGSSDVKIAIFDSGVSAHPDLNLVDSINLTEEPVGLGRSGDHGTHCAGIAAAKGNNTIGVTGVCMNCKILSAKTLIIDKDNYDYTTNKVYTDAFNWAMTKDVDVINNSWGYDGDNTEPAPSYYNTIFNNLTSNGRAGRGIVIVFSAGNDSMPILDGTLKSHPLIITVGATDYLDRRSCYSDYGVGLDVLAPSSSGFSGDGFLDNRTWTTDPIGFNNGYNKNGLAYKYIDGEAVNRTLDGENLNDVDENGQYTRFFGGTSSAAPLVSGLSALIISENPNLSYSQVMNIIISTADKVDAQSSSSCNTGEECDFTGYDENGHSICGGFGKINAYRALLKAGNALCVVSQLYESNCNNGLDDDCDGLVDSLDMDCQNIDKCERRICPDRETCHPLDWNPLRTTCDCATGYKEFDDTCVPDICSNDFVLDNCGENTDFMHCELAENELDDIVPSCFCNENYIFTEDACIFDCSSLENSHINLSNNACNCNSGYKLNDTMDKCVFDCSEREFSHANLDNNACICDESYKLINDNCVFDCSSQENTHPSSDNKTCDCNDGYIYSPEESKCIKSEIYLCENKQCDQNSECFVNLAMQAKCICNEGYEMDESVINTTQNKCTQIIEKQTETKDRTESSACSYSQKNSSFPYFILLLVIVFIKQRKSIIK